MSASKGRQAEEIALNHLLSLGYKIRARNQKIAGVEVDLLMEKSSLFIFEVKSLRSFDEIGFRISKNQKQRLRFARSFLQELTGTCVQLNFIFVSKEEIICLGEADF